MLEWSLLLIIYIASLIGLLVVFGKFLPSYGFKFSLNSIVSPVDITQKEVLSRDDPKCVEINKE